MPEDSSQISVETERLLRLQRATTLAAEGSFGEALELLEDSSQGALGELERALRSLIADYKLAIEQNAFAIAEFSATRRELEQKIETIDEHRETIQRLSAPIIDVWEGVVTVPLTGTPDERHTNELTARLLTRIASTHIAWVILDLTGTPQIDTMIASQLVKLSQAIRLMGADCLITGLGAEVAKTLVSLGVSLQGVRSIATLKEALKYCLFQKGPAERRVR